MNRRMLIIILLFLVFTIGLCLFLAAAYLPKYRDDLGNKQSTSTQAAYINQTQAFIATGTAAQVTIDAKTQEAMILQTAQAATVENQTRVAATLTAQPTLTRVPTATLSPTPTFTPSPTFTPTLIPTAAICAARVVGTDRRVYIVPGGGKNDSSIPATIGQQLNVIGRLEDPGWYKVDYQGTQGWMRSDFIHFETECQPTIYRISYLLGIKDKEEEVILDDTFSTNLNRWTYSTGSSAVYPTRSNYNDEQLLINSESIKSVRLLSGNPKLANLSNFHLYVSFNRTVYDRETSWAGLRFRTNSENYYLLTLTPLCRLTVFANQDIVFQRDIPPAQCLGSTYFLEVGLSGYDLNVKINDAEPVLLVLPDQGGLFTSGGIALEAANAKVRYEFVVITIPR